MMVRSSAKAEKMSRYARSQASRRIAAGGRRQRPVFFVIFSVRHLTFPRLEGIDCVCRQKNPVYRSVIMYEYTVEGMSCNHCVMAVKKSVNAADPAARVEVDLSTQTVKVESTAGKDVIAARIEEAGYPVLAGK